MLYARKEGRKCKQEGLWPIRVFFWNRPQSYKQAERTSLGEGITKTVLLMEHKKHFWPSDVLLMLGKKHTKSMFATPLERKW